MDWRVAGPIRRGVAAAALTGAAGLALAAPGYASARGLSASGGAGFGPAAAGGVAPSTAGLPGAPGRSTPTHPLVAGSTARIIDGLAYAPASAPAAVQRAIWAGDRIRHKPYLYGGGHASFRAAGYDCSGSVSYVLHAAGLLSAPMDSSDLLSWGQTGVGQWITVYTNPAHAFVEVAGIRLDTSSEGDPAAASGSGPRWRPVLGDTSAFTARHPSGL